MAMSGKVDFILFTLSISLLLQLDLPATPLAAQQKLDQHCANLVLSHCMLEVAVLNIFSLAET